MRVDCGSLLVRHQRFIVNASPTIDVAEQRRKEEHLHEPIGVIVSKERWDEVVASTAQEVETRSKPSYDGHPRNPADGEEHGELVSRETTRAHYSGGGNSNSPGYTYESVTSFTRIWEDGYTDYECQVCGMAKASPRAVASHRQVHIKAGEVERDMRFVPESTRGRRKNRAELRIEKMEFVDELPPDLEEQEQQLVEAIISGEPETSDADEIVAAIIRLVLPGLLTDQDAVINALTVERDEALKRLAEVEGEFDALLDLLNSRKKS